MTHILTVSIALCEKEFRGLSNKAAQRTGGQDMRLKPRRQNTKDQG
jgi:hypothetical protein